MPPTCGDLWLFGVAEMRFAHAIIQVNKVMTSWRVCSYLLSSRNADKRKIFGSKCQLYELKAMGNVPPRNVFMSGASERDGGKRDI